MGQPQAIAGVSPELETIIRTQYPSIAATGLGRLLGSLYESIPIGFGVIRLSYLLFTVPTSPLAFLWYFLLKVFGSRYVLTNRSVQKWKALGQRMIQQVPLSEVAEVAVRQAPGQVFYKAADLDLIGRDGALLMRLEGVSRAEVFRETILEARDARRQVEASLSAIKARQPA